MIEEYSGFGQLWEAAQNLNLTESQLEALYEQIEIGIGLVRCGEDMEEEAGSQDPLPEDQLLFGRSDWTHSVDACQCLLAAGVVTVGDLLRVSLPVLEMHYGLKDADAESLLKLLHSLGFSARRPRARKRYDDWKRPR